MRAARFLLLLALGLSSQGCALFVREPSPLADVDWPPPRQENPPADVSLVLKVQKFFNGNLLPSVRVSSDAFFPAAEDATVRAYRESGYFARVLPGAVDTDVRAEITLIDSTKGSLFPYLALCLFSCVGSKTYTLKTTIERPAGRVVREIVKTETQTIWIYPLPSWVVIPSMVFDRAYSDSTTLAYYTAYDLNRLTILEAAVRGLWQRLPAGRVKEERGEPEREAGSRIEGNQREEAPSP